MFGSALFGSVVGSHELWAPWCPAKPNLLCPFNPKIDAKIAVTVTIFNATDRKTQSSDRFLLLQSAVPQSSFSRSPSIGKASNSRSSWWMTMVAQASSVECSRGVGRNDRQHEKRRMCLPSEDCRLTREFGNRTIAGIGMQERP
jgi:hypothetical protein